MNTTDIIIIIGIIAVIIYLKTKTATAKVPTKEPSIWNCDPDSNSYETDQYRNIRRAPDCPRDAIWHCDESLDGYETNQYRTSRLSEKCPEKITNLPHHIWTN